MPLCMDCVSMNYKDRYGCDAKCELRGRYYNPYSNAVCSEFKENNIPRSELERRYEIRKNYAKENKSSDCYLTTAICNILNYDDDCNYLEKLRYFRDNIMLNDKKYYDLLVEYNIVGPMIAKSLIEDENRKEISINLLINYIVPVYFKINNHRYNEATSIYIDMVNNLKNHYGLEDILIIKKDNTFLPKIKTKKEISKLKQFYNIKRV